MIFIEYAKIFDEYFLIFNEVIQNFILQSYVTAGLIILDLLELHLVKYFI